MRTLLVVSILATAATTASAEPDRSGFMIGASLGAGGATACHDCDRMAGGAAEIHIGAWLTPRFALSFEEWVFTGDPTSLVYHGTGGALATATLHVAPRWYVKGGAGLALYEYQDQLAEQLLNMNERAEYRGVGLGTGVGYELYQSKGSIVIDVSARTFVGLYPGHGASMAGSGLLGFSWN